ncbi:MAG: glycosyltransferase family 2 protein [Clostridia bacterium]|nr:glycosyltransferase family 2 protein [Clostridia bacterium]
MGESNQPTVSVIVPVYNAAKTLPRTIASVLNQSFADFELIMVDDGSTDDSGAVCRQFAQSDSRIRVLSQKNGGVSRARNAGIVASRGRYITFLDADDELVSSFLQEAVGDCESKRLDMWLGTTIRLLDGKECGRNEVWENFEAYGDELTEEQFIMLFNCAACAYAKLYRRECVTDHLFRTDLVWGEDLYFSFAFMERHIKLQAKRSIVYHYCWSGSGLASSITLKRCKSMPKVYRYMLDMIDRRKYSEGIMERHIKERWLGDLYYVQNAIVRQNLSMSEKRELFYLLLSDKKLKSVARSAGVEYVSLFRRMMRCMLDDIVFIVKRDGIFGVVRRILRRLHK